VEIGRDSCVFLFRRLCFFKLLLDVFGRSPKPLKRQIIIVYLFGRSEFATFEYSLCFKLIVFFNFLDIYFLLRI